MTDRDLIRLHWPVDRRAAFDALMAIDDAFGEVVASTSQPALGAIRLDWWREALERLDHGPPPPEPRLSDVAGQLLPLGISGTSVGAIEQGWAALLDERPDPEAAAKRGEALFAIAAQLLGASDPRLAEAGWLFAIADAARRGLIEPGIQSFAAHRFPPRLRPLTALARLAARDLARWPAIEPEATPARAAALLAHRLGGRIESGPKRA